VASPRPSRGVPACLNLRAKSGSIWKLDFGAAIGVMSKTSASAFNEWRREEHVNSREQIASRLLDSISESLKFDRDKLACVARQFMTPNGNQVYPVQIKARMVYGDHTRRLAYPKLGRFLSSG
jgi:hypothetical protein